MQNAETSREALKTEGEGIEDMDRQGQRRRSSDGSGLGIIAAILLGGAGAYYFLETRQLLLALAMGALALAVIASLRKRE